MRIVDLIEKKKNKLELTPKEIKFIIQKYISEVILDYQMAALVMAITINGMTKKETLNLTKEMIKSGDTIDLSSIKGIKVDKHSTGGIGDKTTIAIAPIIASLGVKIAKISGRGLGFTGGTLDKLESIPNFNINYSKEKFIKQVNKIGIALMGQTKNIVPADKKLYALRDVTGTIESLPLIVSSIMSKKIATGADTFFFDVKCGNGALMKTYKDAKKLAKWLIQIARDMKKDVRVEITSMDTPLGRAIGNKNEVIEAIEALKGNGTKDFMEIIESTCSTLLLQSKLYSLEKDALNAIRKTIKNGNAFKKFKEWIIAQNGDIKKLLSNNFWNPKFEIKVKAKKNGFMTIKSAIDFGIVAMKLGAGRLHKKDCIDNEAGIYLNKKTNEKVKINDILFTLYSSKKISKEMINNLKNAYKISKYKIKNKVIIKKIK